MTYIYLSYVKEDAENADRLHQIFMDNGMKVWCSKDDIKSDQVWQDTDRWANDTRQFFVACFSKEYITFANSDKNEELFRAVKALRSRPSPKDQTWFIPVLLSGEIPDYEIGGGRTIRDLNCIDLSSKKWIAGMDSLRRIVCPEKTIRDMNFLSLPEPKRKHVWLYSLAYYQITGNPDGTCEEKWRCPFCHRIEYTLDNYSKAEYECPECGAICIGEDQIGTWMAKEIPEELAKKHKDWEEG